MVHIPRKRGINRMILSAMLLTLFIAVEAAPVQAAERAELVMDGKAVSPGTVVALPKGAAVAFSLKLDGAYGMGYTSGNGAVAQTGTVQRFSDGKAVYAVKAIGQLGDSAGLYIDGEKILEMKITEGAVCPACGEADCTFVQIVTGEWRADGAERPCVHYAYGQDARESQSVAHVYTCTQCGTSSRLQTGIAHRWICHGSRG